MNKKKIINIIIGIVIIVVAAFLLISSKQQQGNGGFVQVGGGDATQATPQTAGQPAQPSAEYVGLVIARRDIAKGTVIGPDMIKQKKAAASEMGGDDIDNPDAVVGKVATIDIILGEKITRSKLTLRAGEQQLSMKIPEGKRAVTIPIDKISSLEGMIKPSDRVDIMGMFPYTSAGPQGQPYTENVIVSMFENVLVLAVGNNISGMGGGEGREGYASMTFALSLEESSLLIYSLQLGTIRLLLRSPDDTGTSKIKTAVTMSTLQEKLFSIKSLQQQQPAQPPSGVGEVGGPKGRGGPDKSQSADYGKPDTGSSSQIEVFMGGASSAGSRGGK